MQGQRIESYSSIIISMTQKILAPTSEWQKTILQVINNRIYGSQKIENIHAKKEE